MERERGEEKEGLEQQPVLLVGDFEVEVYILEQSPIMKKYCFYSLAIANDIFTYGMMRASRVVSYSLGRPACASLGGRRARVHLPPSTGKILTLTASKRSERMRNELEKSAHYVQFHSTQLVDRHTEPLSPQARLLVEEVAAQRVAQQLQQQQQQQAQRIPVQEVRGV